MISSHRSRHSKQTETLPSPRTFSFGVASLPQKLQVVCGRNQSVPVQHTRADVHVRAGDQFLNDFLSLSTEATNEDIRSLPVYVLYVQLS